MALITITDEKLEEILIEVGVPILDIADLPYTSDQIKKSFIYPAMREYFKYFPIVDQVEYTIGTSFSIDFPDAETFSVEDARLITNTESNGMTPDPLTNAFNITSLGRSGGRYGTRYNYGINRSYYSDRASYKAQRNSQNAFKFKVNRNSRKIEGYSNVNGKIVVTWAKISLDYDDIPLMAENEVRRLASSYILQGWGGLISMQSSDGINEMDSGYFLDRAKELKDEVMEKWKGYSKVVVLRN